MQGVLATSRALGDYPLKDQKVIVCEPDILSFQLDKNPPDFAILGLSQLFNLLLIHGIKIFLSSFLIFVKNYLKFSVRIRVDRPDPSPTFSKYSESEYHGQLL